MSAHIMLTNPGSFPGNLILPSGWPDHENIFGLDLGLQGLGLHSMPPPPVTERHGDGLLGIILSCKYSSTIISG